MIDSNVENSENVDSGNPNNKVNNDNLTSPEHNTNSNREPRINNISKSLFKKMVILIREFCFLLLLVLTYATFHNNTPKVSNAPQAFPFFPEGSIVKDWYRGQLSDAIILASESDLAFVMYYAPWDAESQAVKREFSIVSQHMHKYVHFAAINCWQPGSECHAQYSKVYSWPVLMAYPTHGRGIQYKGPKKAEHMMKFLQAVLQPFSRITTEAELNIIKAHHEVVVVGYVDAQLGSFEYGVLYTTALRVLERDPYREIRFLVVTGNTSVIQNEQFPALQLVLWNETLTYPIDKAWKVEHMFSWIFENLHQVSVWANPAGIKSHYLTRFLQPGPALVLFTPRNPLYDLTDYYNVLQEVAMEYYNCEKSIMIDLQKMILYTIRGTKKDYYIQYKELLDKCSLDQKSRIENFGPVVTYDISRLLLNNTCSPNDNTDDSVCLDMIRGDKCDQTITVQSYTKIPHTGHSMKKENKYSKEKNEQKIPDIPWISMLTGKDDPKSSANLQQEYQKEKCHFLNLANHLHPALFTPRTKEQNDYKDSVMGLGCKSNMSLTMVAIDSLQNYYFAERLGIDILKRKDKTAAVIIHSEFETHYVMSEPYNIKNLRNFIRNFIKGQLERVLATSIKPISHTNMKTNTASQIRMLELTTSTFLPTVMQQDKVFLIMYHSVKCAFCSGISHVLLTISRLLRPVNRLQFARIDGDENSLPWEYSMHHYPTILFFPAQRKSESRAFPQNVPITIPNILSFILANVEPEMRLHIMWTLCTQTKYDQDKHACARTLRLESTSLVGKLLREYRSANSAKQSAVVFKRLQNIRLLQFLFTSPVKLHSQIIQQHMSMLYLNSQIELNVKQKNV